MNGLVLRSGSSEEWKRDPLRLARKYRRACHVRLMDAHHGVWILVLEVFHHRPRSH